MGELIQTDLAVLGAGPGGYTAAFRAADLGLKVTLIERYPELGGVCLNVGCIPSKALLHIARVIDEVAELKAAGIDLGGGRPDPHNVRRWADGTVKKLNAGLKQLAKQRKVQVVHGVGTFKSPNELTVSDAQGATPIQFKQAIIAAGSQAVKLPHLPDDPRIMDSTAALQLTTVPPRMLVIGGGIIGLELATVYAALGARITVVEMLDSLMAGCDTDLVRPLERRIGKRYDAIYLKTRVTAVEPRAADLLVSFEGPKAPATAAFDTILVAVGRQPNGHRIGAVNAGIMVGESGFILVDDQMRTNVPHLFAIGDIAGKPMLAHKASHEGRVAAEVCAGMKSGFNQRVIPSVAYTDPEVAWVGMTETDAKAQGLRYGKGVFPWAASGRALALGRDEGMTKLLFDEASRRVIGMAAVGANAGDLIAEGALAIEMGCDAEDLALTIHAHPTLSETVAMAAEAYLGTITDLYLPKKT
jgi:dihydrolipoamide dehydrogenase